MGVCNWWICSRFDDCLLQYPNCKYPPCACCVKFNQCDLCTRRFECLDLVLAYLPDLYRRMVHDIRLGVDTDFTAQAVRRRTLGGRKRD